MTRKKKPAAGVMLSKRQAEILEGVSRGDTYGTLANRLALSPSTIGYHVGRLQQKLNTQTVPSLIVLVMVAGILTSDQFPAQVTGNLFIDDSFIPD